MAEINAENTQLPCSSDVVHARNHEYEHIEHITNTATTHLHLTVLFSVFNPGFSLTLRIYQQRIPCCLGDNNTILDR